MLLDQVSRVPRRSTLVLALATLLLGGCVPTGPKPAVKTAPKLEAVGVAPGQVARPLALTAFLLDFAPGKAVDYYEAGLGCAPTRTSGKEKDVSSPQAQQLLLGFVAAAFEDRGYRIDRGGTADLTLTPSWLAYTATICVPYTSIGDTLTGFGRVWVQMRWILADRARGEVLLDRVTEGNADIAISIEKVAMELVRRALHQAVGNLLADPEAIALLAGHAPTTAGNTDLDSTPRNLPDKAPGSPSSLSPKALAGAQAAFDQWLAGNRAGLAAAVAEHLAVLGRSVPGGVAAIEAATVRDLTAEGYVVELAYATAAGPAGGRFQVTLNEGRLKRLALLQ